MPVNVLWAQTGGVWSGEAQAGVVRRVVDSLKEVVCPHREALAMLLSNVTLATAGAERLLQLQDDEALHGTRPPP